jgi:class 3 adenylate cyclase/ligand-binding sensor domain-containing protein/HD superfamily phosphodiesterase
MNFLHTSRRFNFIFLALILGLRPGFIISATHFQELGKAHIQTYHPGQYSYVNHYNSVTQDDNGFLYIGSQNGIFRFDGSFWNDLKIPGDFILSRTSQDIFGFTRNKFGYLVKTRDGTSSFFGINMNGYTLFEEGDSINRVLASDGTLYVLTRKGLFTWEGDLPEKIDLPFHADEIFQSTSGILVYGKHEGIYHYEDGQLSVLTEAGDLPVGHVSDLLTFNGTRIMVDGYRGQARFSDNQGITAGFSHLDSLLASGQYSCLIGLSTGHLAWGTRKGGVIITDHNGRVIKHISNKDGLSSNHVVSLFIDGMDHLWVVHPQSLSRVEFPSAFTFFNEGNGLKGNVNDLVRHKGNLYAATNHGLYYLVQATDTTGIPGKSYFNRIPDLEEECRQIIGTTESLYTLTPDGIYRLSDRGLDNIIASRINLIHYSARTGLLLAGSDQELLIFHGDSIVYRDSVIMEIYDIAESKDGRLWLLSRQQKVYRSGQYFDGPGDLNFVEYSTKKIFGEFDAYVDLIPVEGQIYFSGSEGLFRYHYKKGQFVRDTIFSFPHIDGIFRISHIARDANQNYWVNFHFPEEGRNETYIAEKQEGGGFELYKMQYRRMHVQHINCLYPDDDQVMWIGSQSGILRYDPAFVSPIKPVFHTHIINVIFTEDSVYNYGFIKSDEFAEQHEDKRVVIPYARNRIRFLVLSTDFSTEASPMFQYRLIGLQEKWSDWSENASIEFRGLSRGKYDLLVRSQDIYGSVSESDSFSFRIKSPFYISWYAILFYVLLFILIFIAYQKWRAIQHGKEHIRLEEIIEERTEALIKEKEKTENLLANILPKKTADELKSKGKVTSSKFKMVTVLFADIEGFTKIAEQMNPEKLIDELDHFYFQFDSVVEKYNIEKIKTIGDAYMAAGGIPVKNRTNPVEVILAAMEMQYFLKGLKDNMADIWDLRIGIHTGSVIAGVVGQKKFSYDIWGDTVNTASRMESSGKIGKINISASTYQLVKEFFDCEFRGKMPVKYKGDIAMYFVERIKPDLCKEDGLTPNTKFLIQIQLLHLLDLEDYIMDRMGNELPDKSLYHNIQHTGHVYRQVELLGKGEQVSQEDMLLLRSAALLHDMGYIDTFDNHEIRSVEYAREILPLYRFKERQIDAICDLIMATKLPPGPSSLLEKIICDANLDHLGRADFLIQSDRLFQEYLLNKKIKNKKDWNLKQVELLENHEFYTDTARKLREISTEQQIENIKQFS